MLDEARKREQIANAVLGATFALSAAQSPKDFVRTGSVEAPGTALMQRWGRVRGEAERNLDSGRVVARNRKLKTFKEFVEEAYIVEAKGQPTFSSREDLERHYGGVPEGMVANNSTSAENPKMETCSCRKKKRTSKKKRRKKKSSYWNSNTGRTRKTASKKRTCKKTRKGTSSSN
jgi:hypothetical protein